MLKHCGNYADILTNYASFLHQKCFSDSPKDIYYRSQAQIIKNVGTLHTFRFLQISAGIDALCAFKMLADFCWACSELISVLLGPSDDVIQVDELDAIGIYIHFFFMKICHEMDKGAW